MAGAERELSPDSLMLQCVDLRRRLRQTEKSLQGLSSLETDSPAADNQDRMHTDADRREVRYLHVQGRHRPYPDAADPPNHSRMTSMETVPILTMDDLSPGHMLQEQGLNSSQSSSTLGSLRAFQTPALPSSTPKQQPQRSSYTRDMRGANSSFADDSTSIVREEIQRLQDERRLLKEEITLLREENTQIIRQNQSHVHDLERGKLESRKAHEKISLLSGEIEKYRYAMADMEEKVNSLTAETQVQDNALRNAEERCESCQKELAEVKTKCESLQNEIAENSEELTEEKKLRRRMEVQREKALQEQEEFQSLLSAYQRKAKEKIAKLEGQEDHLRDSLSHANQEREELLERSCSLQEQVDDLEEEIRQLKEQIGVELDAKDELEEVIHTLKSQLTQQNAKIAVLEKEGKKRDTVVMENAELHAKVQSQESQLAQCQKEINDSRSMLEQLEKLAHQVRISHSKASGSAPDSLTSDSGVGSTLMERPRGSIQALSDRCSRHSSPNSANKGRLLSGGAFLQSDEDVRLQLSVKEAEVQRLQATLQAHVVGGSGPSRSSTVVESLRSELVAAMEKARSCDRKSQEAENILNQLELDRSHLMTELSEVKRESADREAICASLESRLKQRDVQLTELQHELGLQSSAVHSLERELRKKTAQIKSLEEQLDEKVGEFTMHITRMKVLEDEAALKNDEIVQLRDDLAKKEKSLREMLNSGENTRKVQQEQFMELQHQIDMLQDQLEEKSSQCGSLQSDVGRLQADLEGRDTKLQQLITELTQTKQELSMKSRDQDKMFVELEKQTGLATTQIRDMETALVVCRDEMKLYMDQLEQSKDKFERDLSDKNKQITLLDRQLKQTYQEVEERDQQVADLERSVREQQNMLQQSSVRIGELEDSQADLQSEVSRLEQQILQEKSRWVEESHALERKLHQACADLEQRTAQLSQLTQALQAVQTEKVQLEEDEKSLEEDLQEKRNKIERGLTRISQLEKELRDMRVLVEHKAEMIQDLEDTIQSKNEASERQNKRDKDKDLELEDMKAELRVQQERSSEVRKQLQHSQFDVRAKEQLLEDMRETLKCCQDDVSERRREVQDLEQALQERQWELQQRAAQVSRLESTMKDYQQQVEERTNNLQTELENSQAERQHITKQLSDIDDRLQTTQHELREKTLQLQQARQTIGRLEQEQHDTEDKMVDMSEIIEAQKRKFNEQKEELQETTQQLRLSREQLQQQHGEVNRLHLELVESREERDKLAHEMERIIVSVQVKDSDLAKLKEEIEQIRDSEMRTESQQETEILRLRQEIGQLLQQHQTEISQLQEDYVKVLSSNQELSTQSRLQEKDMQEKSHQHEMESREASLELERLEEELTAKKILLGSTHETMVLKDAEIARLQARISGFERGVGMRATEKWLSQREPSVTKFAVSELSSEDVNRQSLQRLDWNRGTIFDQSGRSYENTSSQELTLRFNTADLGHRGFSDSHRDLVEITGQGGGNAKYGETLQGNSPQLDTANTSHSAFSESRRDLIGINASDMRGDAKFPVPELVEAVRTEQSRLENQHSSRSDVSGVFGASDYESDRETLQRSATDVRHDIDARYHSHNGSSNTRHLARTLNFNDSAMLNISNNSTTVDIPVRDLHRQLKTSSRLNPNLNASGTNSSNSATCMIPTKIPVSVPASSNKNRSNYGSTQPTTKQSLSRSSHGHDGRTPPRKTEDVKSNPDFKVPVLWNKKSQSPPGAKDEEISLSENLVTGPGKRQSVNFEFRDFENTVTAVQQYNSPAVHDARLSTDSSMGFLPIVSDQDTTLSVEDIQQKLRANELQQQEIDRQLSTLETEFHISHDHADLSQ